MKTLIQKAKPFAAAFLLTLFLTTTSFTVTPVNDQKTTEKTACNIDFTFTSTHTMAYSAIEDSFTDQDQFSSTGWGGTFSYQSGYLIFTVQLANRHLGGTITVTDHLGNPVCSPQTVPFNSSAVWLLSIPSPVCGEHYYVNFS